MKEGVGGVFVLQAIVVAMIIITCLLAFSVNYTKAFRVKNEIRNIIEKHEGLSVEARQEINDAIRGMNYFLPAEYESVCEQMGYDVYNGKTSENGNGVRFCIKCEYADITGRPNDDDRSRAAYYSIVTFVTFDVPLVNNILPFTASFFKIAGETPLIYSDVHAREASEFCNSRR